MNANGAAGDVAIGAGAGPHIWRGLFWREWLARREFVLWALCAWLVGGWVLMVFFHPGWIIGFGAVYAMAAGLLFGGSDALAGTEEFVLSLPPTRRQQWLVRFALACGTTLAFTGLGTLAIAFDLPQRVWSLFVESGFTEPFAACEPPMLYGLAVAIPFCVLAFTFCIASSMVTRPIIVLAPFAGASATGGLVLLFVALESALWDTHGEPNGFIMVPGLLASGVLLSLSGYRMYLRREGITRPRGAAGGRTAGLIVVLVVLAVLAFFFLALVPAQDSMAPRIYEATEAAAPDRLAPSSGSVSVPATAPAQSTTTEPAGSGGENNGGETSGGS